jgi:hypothetical protein
VELRLRTFEWSLPPAWQRSLEPCDLIFHGISCWYFIRHNQPYNELISFGVWEWGLPENGSCIRKLIIDHWNLEFHIFSEKSRWESISETWVPATWLGDGILRGLGAGKTCRSGPYRGRWSEVGLVPCAAQPEGLGAGKIHSIGLGKKMLLPSGYD